MSAVREAPSIDAIGTARDPERAVQAKRIIEQEHRSLAAVLHGLLYSIREIRYLQGEPDFTLLHAMLDYIESFLEKFHHPKEDLYLFERLRARCPGAIRLVDRLHEEHVGGTARLHELRRSLARYQDGGRAEFPEFAQLAAQCAAFHWSHMSAEENEVLPLASAPPHRRRLGADRRRRAHSCRQPAPPGGFPPHSQPRHYVARGSAASASVTERKP